MQRRAFFFQVNLNHFFGIIPSAAGIGHIQSLEQTKGCDRNQIAGKQIRIETGKSNGKAENDHKDVKHPLLRIDSADFNHFLGIFDRSGLVGVEFDMLFDVGNRTVGAGRNGLH